MNFRQVLSDIDVAPLLHQISDNPQLWNTDESWSKYKNNAVIENVENIVLRYNKSSLPGLNDWDKKAFGILSAAQKIIFDLMRAIPGEHLGKVLITRLRPGEIIRDHIDTWPVVGTKPYFQRYQIPLAVASGVIFKVLDEELHMRPGEAWWFDNQAMHSVINNSDEDRISMLADIRPFISPAI
jgi:hypothetical protein